VHGCAGSSQQRGSCISLGVAGVGELYGLSRGLTLPIAAATLLAIVLTGSYRRVERITVAVGLEFAFFFVAWAANPNLHALVAGSLDIPFHNKAYAYLVAANIGAVIMPRMIFCQQSAIADKRLRPEHLGAARAGIPGSVRLSPSSSWRDPRRLRSDDRAAPVADVAQYRGRHGAGAHPVSRCDGRQRRFRRRCAWCRNGRCDRRLAGLRPGVSAKSPATAALSNIVPSRRAGFTASMPPASSAEHSLSGCGRTSSRSMSASR
jgi:Natural resistance-associated macrophage protein